MEPSAAFQNGMTMAANYQTSCGLDINYPKFLPFTVQWAVFTDVFFCCRVELKHGDQNAVSTGQYDRALEMKHYIGIAQSSSKYGQSFSQYGMEILGRLTPGAELNFHWKGLQPWQTFHTSFDVSHLGRGCCHSVQSCSRSSFSQCHYLLLRLCPKNQLWEQSSLIRMEKYWVLQNIGVENLDS